MFQKVSSRLNSRLIYIVALFTYIVQEALCYFLLLEVDFLSVILFRAW